MTERLTMRDLQNAEIRQSVPSGVRRIFLVTAAVAVATFFVSSCDTALPFDTSECTEVLDGRCWTFLGPDKYITTLADTPWGVFAGTRTSYWGTNTGVFHLEPESNTWQARGLDHSLVSSMLLTGTDTSRLLVGMFPQQTTPSEAAIFATEDGGNTWLPWDGGLAAEYDGYAGTLSLAMDPSYPNRLYWGMAYNILRSENGGRSWNYVRGGGGEGGGGVHDIVVSPSGDGSIWASNTTGYGNATIVRSTDWGDSWQETYSTNYDLNILKIVIDPKDTSRLWFAEGAPNVRRSDDAGLTWSVNLTLPQSGAVAGLVLTGQDLIAASRESTGSGFAHSLHLYHSNTGGDAWNRLAAPGSAQGATRMVLADDGSLLIGTDNGIWRVSN